MTSRNPHCRVPSRCRTPKSAEVTLCAAVASLIVATALRAGEVQYNDAVNVFHCAFGDEGDVNFDRWPDRWVRKTGPSFPQYVNIEIRDDAAAPSNKCLAIDLDGASAAVTSPPIRVLSRFSYVFEAQLKKERLAHSTVAITLNFCDSTGRVLQSASSEPPSNAKGWEAVRLGPIAPSDPAIDRVIIEFQAQRGAKGDLQGRVALADVRLARLPRIAVTTNNPCNVYTRPDDVVVRCELSGIPERDPEIHFQLLDAFNNELQSDQRSLNGQLIVNAAATAAKMADGDVGPCGFDGATEWRPSIPDYGSYRVVVNMLSSESADDDTDAARQLGSRTIDFVVVPSLAMPRQGEFGWTLPEGDQPLSFHDLSRLLPQVGINWVKVPVWFDAGDPRRGDDLIRFVELLGASNIDVVGIIDRPPADSELAAQIGWVSSIADLLAQNSATWLPSLESAMSRLSLRVRWWQLGRDDDTSFASLPELNNRMEELRTAIFRFGQDARMGMSWEWTNADAYTGNVAWEFQQLRSDTQPSEEQLDELLGKPAANSAQRWVSVEAPPQVDVTHLDQTDEICRVQCQQFVIAPTLMAPQWAQLGSELGQVAEAAHHARAGEFVRRLVSAKVRGADAIIVAHPFNDENGLMRANGMPAEMLLPWRTTAAMLGGAEYLGQMQLPGDSANRVFMRRDGQVVMVVWNQEPTREVLYLGNDVRRIDIFGRSAELARENHEQVVEVGPTPMFVLGLHEAITRWRLTTVFDKRQVPGIPAKPHHNSLNFRNFFSQGVGGSLKIVVLDQRQAGSHTAVVDRAAASALVPDNWTIEPPQATFQMAADEVMQFPFEIRLKNALFGKHPVRIDFNIEADERVQFSVYRQMEVGTEDLTIDVRTRVDKDDTLIVEQLMTNTAARLADFKCYLRAKGHRPQRMQVYRLGPNPDRKVYRFADGYKLVGEEMQLELEELNGPRVLKYRFVATAESPATQEASGADVSRNDAPRKEPAYRRPLANFGS